MDEPFNGLDIETSRTLHSILIGLRAKQKIVLITSHILDTLTDLCDEIHYLEAGTVKKSLGKTHFELFKEELYEGMAQNISTNLIRYCSRDSNKTT